MGYLKVETSPLFPKIRAGLASLLGDLDANEWEAPTVCEGWNVKDIALHLLGVEIGSVSRRRDGMKWGPRPGQDLVKWLNEDNEAWVRESRRISPDLLMDLLDYAGRLFEEHLETLDEDAVTAHVSWASNEPVPVWLDIAREYTERWVHQQQIRDATDRHGFKEAEFLGAVIRTFVHALPKTYAGVHAPQGTTVQLRVDGPGGGAWHAALSRDEWELEWGDYPTPDATVTMDADTAWRVFTRNPGAGNPIIDGNDNLGRHVLRSVAIIA